GGVTGLETGLGPMGNCSRRPVGLTKTSLEVIAGILEYVELRPRMRETVRLDAHEVLPPAGDKVVRKGVTMGDDHAVVRASIHQRTLESALLEPKPSLKCPIELA